MLPKDCIRKFNDPELQDFYELAAERYLAANDGWNHWRDLDDFVYFLRSNYTERTIFEQMDRLYILGVFDKKSYNFQIHPDLGEIYEEKFRLRASK